MQKQVRYILVTIFQHYDQAQKVKPAIAMDLGKNEDVKDLETLMDDLGRLPEVRTTRLFEEECCIHSEFRILAMILGVYTFFNFRVLSQPSLHPQRGTMPCR